MNKCNFLLHSMGLISTVSSARASSATAKWGIIEVVRNPGCGCCENWAEGLKAAGFDVSMSDNSDLEGYRAWMDVPADLAGCHTGKIEGYIIEGHVPAADIVKLLIEHPVALGLAVPGMPIGSPGMESGNEKETYDVVLFKSDGARAVYASY